MNRSALLLGVLLSLSGCAAVGVAGVVALIQVAGEGVRAIQAIRADGEAERAAPPEPVEPPPAGRQP